MSCELPQYEDAASRVSEQTSSEMTSAPSEMTQQHTVHVSIDHLNPQLMLASPETEKMGMVQGILQQREPWALAPLWFFRPVPQAVCSLVAAAICALIGGLVVGESSNMQDVAVCYDHTVQEREFVLHDAIDGDVLVSYELPGVYMNHKRLVESKDSGVLEKATLSFISAMTCEDASTKREALWRRPGSDWERLIGNERIPSTAAFRPCGLLANSMFIDEYEFFQESQEGWAPLSVDETDIALPTDDDLFVNDAFRPGDGGPNDTDFVIDGTPSWLLNGSFFEHFKVWYRNPAAPHVRNLWARIPGGLAAGTYKMGLKKNSHIWTEQWGVREKCVRLASSHALGSKGSASIVGAVFVGVAVVEVLMALVFIIGPTVARQLG